MNTKRYEVVISDENGVIAELGYDTKEEALRMYEKARHEFYSVQFFDRKVFVKKQLH